MFSAVLASLRQEKQKIGAMHRAQAARYLFDYYKLPAIVLLCALLLTVYFAAALLRPRENPDLQVLFVNCYDNVSQDSELMRAFRAYQDARGLNLSARFDANVFFNLSRTADYATAYFQKAVAQLEGGETDAIVCTRENLLGIASGGRLMDLSGAKALAPYAERMICMQTQAGETVPVGIDLTGCPAFDRLGFYPDGVCLGVSAYTQRLESVRIWLDFLFLLEK